MASERNLGRMLLLRIMLVAMATVMRACSQAVVLPRPDCPSTCGNVSIPYPFGVGEGCYLNPQFEITCNSTYSPPKAFLRKGNIKVIDISAEGELRIYTLIGSNCMGDQSGNWTSTPLSSLTTLSAFSFSATRNRFTAVGCDTLATIRITSSSSSSPGPGCLSICNRNTSFTEGSCDGFGCCQTAIPKYLRTYSVSVNTYNNDTAIWRFSPCSYVFIGEEVAFNFSRDDLRNMSNRATVPTVIDWAVWNETCEGARRNSTSYACKAVHSQCYDPENINGYRCNCSEGYQGNAYLPGGCIDINECEKPKDNNCTHICHNTEGSYTCSCRKGYRGDGRSDGDGCISDEKSSDQLLVIKITVGLSAGITALLFTVGILYLGMKKRNLIRLKEKYFKQNGGLLLQQQLGDRDQSTRSHTEIFTAEELKNATNNYDDTRIVGRGGYGTVYKGVLPNNAVVAIKKSRQVDQTQIEQFVNEVIVLSQINHRNVVKLLGCCLETEVPLLVYEFVGNRTLFDHIHSRVVDSNMSWETRLRIAAETAGVLSYLHSAASVPIIHRDIKSTNILLDENYVAKVSDFGASRLVPLDQTEMSTMVQGTLGYLDPEYLHTSTLTDKSDVYSFGVVLVELLTGKKALSFDRPEEERCLAKYFLSSLKEDRLFQIIEDSIPSNDRDAQQVKEAVLLAARCLRIKGEERPTMKEVAMELEGIRVMANHPWVAIELNPEETENLLGGATDALVYSHSSGAYDSMMNQVILPLAGGR